MNVPFFPFFLTEVLERHLSVPEHAKPATLADVFHHLVFTAKNRHSLPNVIGAAIGGVENLSDILFDFQPNGVLDKYAEGGTEQLLVVSSLGWMRVALQKRAERRCVVVSPEAVQTVPHL
jgi:hypothetical protein